MPARVGVILFPGSNCELDVLEAVRLLGGEAEILWHGDADLHGVDAVVVPGGFAHGGVMQLQLRHGLAGVKFEILGDEVALFRWGIIGSLNSAERKGGEHHRNTGAEQFHAVSPQGGRLPGHSLRKVP